MLTRALLVLLVVLNAGVGLWWLLRPAPVVLSTPVATDAPRLVLLRERLPADPSAIPATPMAGATDAVGAPSTGPAMAAVETDDSVSASAVPPALSPKAAQAPARCYSIGPSSDPALLAQASVRLQPGAQSVRTRTVAAVAARGWQVVIAPAASRDRAQQVATAIGAAGFDDYFVVPTSNAIALGRYGSESSARGRESALRAKGFAAIAEPLSVTPARSWLDVTVTDPAIDGDRLRVAAGGLAVASVACSAPAARVAKPTTAQAAAAPR